MPKLNVLVAGSTGYIGVQLINLLIKHPNIKIKYLCGNSSVGKKISFFDKSLNFKKLPKITKFNKVYLKEVDVIFTALPNGEAQEISNHLLEKNTLIDLAADFRLDKASEYLKWYKQKHKSIKNIKKSIYLLPEINSDKVKDYNIIGCPGCYPTSILLPLIPIIEKKLIKTNNIIIDSKSGYSGAGRGVHQKYKNKNLYESLSAYGVGFHRHNSEIQQELNKYTEKKVTSNSLLNLLKKKYSKSEFIKILKINTLISTNDVINTNNCHISICETKFKNKIIILSAIDNLIKGGAGQAIQNMNIKFNLKKKGGLC